MLNQQAPDHAGDVLDAGIEFAELRGVFVQVCVVQHFDVAEAAGGRGRFVADRGAQPQIGNQPDGARSAGPRVCNGPRELDVPGPVAVHRETYFTG